MCHCSFVFKEITNIGSHGMSEQDYGRLLTYAEKDYVEMCCQTKFKIVARNIWTRFTCEAHKIGDWNIDNKTETDNNKLGIAESILNEGLELLKCSSSGNE